MKTGWMLGIACLLSVNLLGQLPEPKQSGGKFGYMLNGKWVVEPKLQYATHFSEGRALVKQNDLWGYLDSLGNWAILPVFSNAQPFKQGKAIVFKGDKKGLIRPNGSFVVEPLYDDFEIVYQGVEVKNNGKIGLIQEEWETMIPAEYERIDRAFDFFCAQRSDHTFDLFYNGKPVKKGLFKQVQYSDVFTDAKRIRVVVDGKSGIIDYEGNWVVPAEYSNITYHFLGSYLESHFTQPPVIFDLDATLYQVVDEFAGITEPIGPRQHYLADVFGKLLDDKPFESINVIREEPEYGNVIRVELHRDNTLGFLEKNQTIRMTEWESITDYLHWRIYYAHDKAEIVHQSGKKIATFESAEAPFQPFMYYDEYGEPHGSEDGIYEYLPYVKVTKTINGLTRYAVFDLLGERLMTDWLTSPLDVSILWMNGNEPVYQLYHPEEEALMFYTFGDEQPVTNFPYRSLYLMDQGVLLARNKADDLTTVFEIDDEGKTTPLLKVPQAESSLSLYETQLRVSELEGLYDEFNVNRYSEPFVLYKSTAGKMGVMTVFQQKKIFPAVYDTLIQDSVFTYLIHTKTAAGWGAIYLYDATEVPAIYPEKLLFRNNESNGELYAMFYDHYINSTGKTFYTLNSEMELFKHKNAWGVKTASDFNEESRVVVPPLYKSLYQLEDYNRLLAKNKKGMYGIISQLNDTIIPFVYSDIESESYFSPVEESYLFKTHSGKKVGMIDPHSGCTIPAVYDQLTNFQELQGYDWAIQVFNNGKTGLYSYYQLHEFLPCELDAVWGNLQDLGTEFRIQYNQKWYVKNVFEYRNYSLNSFLKTCAYDLIVNDTGYVATAAGFDAYVLQNPYAEPVKMTQPSLPSFEGQAQLFIQNGKIGVKDLNGKIIIPAELTMVYKYTDNTISTVKKGVQGFYSLPMGKFYSTNEW